MKTYEILKRRTDFYLDSDNVCRWKYVGVEYLPPESPIRKRGKVILGVCEVCGKTPIYNNFILKYMGNEKYPTGTEVPVGSECIHFLDEEDMLKFERDKKKLRDNKAAIRLFITSLYLEKILEDNKKLLADRYWTYGGKTFKLTDSIRYVINKFSVGKTIYSYNAHSLLPALKAELATYGIIIPDYREIKKIFGGDKNIMEIYEKRVRLDDV